MQGEWVACPITPHLCIECCAPGAVSRCRQYSTSWDGGARRSDEYTCHVATGTTRAWLRVLDDQDELLSRDDVAAAPGAAASSVFTK